ncbi:MAG: RhuM family protein [Desulfurivibrionaceae bacterium]
MPNEILIYEDPNATSPVQVTLAGETVWLTQRQMAELFDTSTDNVGLHLKNIYSYEELKEEATTEDFSVVQTEGNRQVSRQLKHYNLDAIISVGYRVNSKRGVRFRQWATGVLRRHLAQGYTLNQQRLAEHGLTEAQQALELLSRTLQANALVDETGQAILSLIAGYAKTWRLLLQYDEDALPLPPGCQPARGVLSHDKARAAIAQLKKDLFQRNEATSLFGAERGEALAGILGSIEQTMFGEPLYKTREERAAHLLYFVIKDHPFSDGNKRIGSFLFLLYLQQEGMAMGMNRMALTALALLIAESAPANKDLLVRLIVNLLSET